MARRILIIVVAALLPSVAIAQRQTAGTPAAFEAASMAWARGEYIAALDGFSGLLRGPDSLRWRDSVALMTGELFQTTELTTDGARPAFSADGRIALYETGPSQARVVRVVELATRRVLAEVPGSGGALSPNGEILAWIYPATMSRPPLGVRDLVAGRELTVGAMDGWIPSSVAFGGSEGTMYVVASGPGSVNRNEIVRLSRSGDSFVARGPIADADGYKSAPLEAGDGNFVVHAVPAGNPVRLPSGAAGLRASSSFAIVDLRTRSPRLLTGTAATLSSDGMTLAWIVRDSGSSRLMAMPVSGSAPTIVKTTRDRIDAPALSPDGKRIAYQVMTVHDWELAVIDTDGANERRLTREIQHDLMPQWLDNDRLLAVMGEARHRRSYLYDVTSGQRTRLFHNNTVRTIAPEYEWIASGDGSRILIVAERDGNTVSVERGVYVVDLNRTVPIPSLVDRIAKERASEIRLRDRGVATFARIAPMVRSVTKQVDVARVYQYARSLFEFDSKHISQPGNAQAIAYLADGYRSFGYSPELQWFEPSGALNGRTANVLAVLKGTENPELVYVVSSHFDSRAEGPGADDNSSGTAALLEAARVLAKHPQPATIVFASFTAEESGLLGSREYVRRAVADSVKLVGALNNDMLGWANDGRLDNTIRYSNPGIRDIQHAAAQQFSTMITYDALYYKSTDAAAYYEAYGDIVGGIGSYPVLGNPHYHQSHDVLETINHQLVAEASRTTVATLMLLASSPSRLKGLVVSPGSGNAVDVTWIPSPERGVREYIVAWGGADGSEQGRIRVSSPRARLTGVAAGMEIRVKAVNSRELEGWDWARAPRP